MGKNKTRLLAAAAALCAFPAAAQVGNPYIHDPATIVECDGRYYTFGTGGGGLISEDGWTWNGGAVRPGGGAAPDAMKIGDRYLVAYSATGGGAAIGHRGQILVMWNNTLDPESPDFRYSEPAIVATSENFEDCDAIDAGLCMGPDGRLWLNYGTYFGYIRVCELDPVSGLRKEGDVAKDVAISCEGSYMFYKDGWYYLSATHGTCCDGANSTYCIIVGRSRSPYGPFLDNVGRDMMQGGGKLVLASENRRVGAGHMGRIVVEEGVEKMSFHWEADLDLGGRSTLGIRPVVWEDGWPAAGEILADGSYGIVSDRRGYALELSVTVPRMAGGMRGFGPQTEPAKPVPAQKLEDVIGGWPSGAVDVRMGPDMFRPHQDWSITAVPEAGGYLGGPYYKICINGTDRCLSATEEREVTAEESFSGADSQLWRIEQLCDGSWRIMPKAVPGTDESLALIAIADSTPTLGKFDYGSDNSKWHFRKHQ